MNKIITFQVATLFIGLFLTFMTTLFAQNAFAAGDDSYMPDPKKILHYIYYEGKAVKEFSHMQNHKYIWQEVYSYGEKDYVSTESYQENQQGLVIDEGKYSLRLVYPLKIGKQWSYVNFAGKKITCTITSLNKTVKTKAGTFKNVVEVKESDGRYRYYAKNLGLIKSENPSLIHGDPESLELISVKTKVAIMWGNEQLKRGQIGRITIIKPINLWKRDEQNKLHFVRVLKPGERYRVYSYDQLYGGQYSVGSGYYITKMPAYIKYETPSKQLLNKMKELYSAQ
ncbi:hypothetical protein AT864_02760 [Anoxybacillus sp. P3H1B]|uniref:alpha-amylase n=1 Tax=Anoxybacillus sp. P3H1B TaxID=1769293 RepID=UPI00079B38CF|nr:alpha-amylase [Anoxybacillus sp. P3H1B]KXG09076.1 hypothetical protein AT864_02760 [Anoxybacillus sp. P3H1B]